MRSLAIMASIYLSCGCATRAALRSGGDDGASLECEQVWACDGASNAGGHGSLLAVVTLGALVGVSVAALHVLGSGSGRTP